MLETFQKAINNAVYNDKLPIVGILDDKPVVDAVDACNYLNDSIASNWEWEELFYYIQDIKGPFAIVETDVEELTSFFSTPVLYSKLSPK